VIRVGDLLRAKYRLESSIGKGGMGEVFSALDLSSGRRVAVKVVSRTLVGDLLMARLQREAIAAVRVRSEFVPQVLDVDTTEEGEVFLVMELLRGQTLSERMKRRGHLTWPEVARIGEDVLNGLMDAHAAGVIHRDLKPSNIFIELADAGGRERAKVLDFGVCKLDAPDGEKLTVTGESVGTVAYMAPEQIRGASKVDERADLYSFATVVFETLSGRLAHDAKGQMAMLAAKLECPALRLSDTTLEPIPPGLDALMKRMLSRNADERVATARELLIDWKALGPATVEPRTIPAATLIPDTHHALQPATQTNLTAGTATRLGRRGARTQLLIAAGAIAMAVGALLAMLEVRASSSPPPAPHPVDIVAETPSTPARPDPRTVPGPVLPAQPTPDPPATLAFELPASTGAPSGDTGAVPPPRARSPRFVRPARPPIGVKHAVDEPHIVDKPRY